MSKISFPGGGGAGGGGGVSDHGGLAGLLDDDHSQYLMGDYSRASDHVYATSGHIVTGLAIGASGKIRLVDYALIVETAGVSGLAVRRSDGRVGIASPTTLSSALTVGGDGVVSLVGTTPKIDSTGNLTFEDGGGGSFTSHTTTSFRINNNDLSSLFGVMTDVTTKDAITLRAMVGQTSKLLTFEASGAGNPVVASIDIIGTISGTVVSGANVGAGTEVWISGIPVGNYLAAAAAVDLTAVSTNILPDTSGSYQIGSRSFPFASGVFNNGFWIRGQDDGQSPGFDRNGWNIRTIAMNGSLTNLESNSVILNTAGSMLWGSTQGGFTSPADGEVTLKNSAGTASGVFRAASGIFASGVTLRAPNGSGWVFTVDNAGGLTSTGPSVW